MQRALASIFIPMQAWSMADTIKHSIFVSTLKPNYKSSRNAKNGVNNMEFNSEAPTRLPACRCHVWASFFSFRIHSEPSWFGQNRAVSADDRNRPKSALNHARTAEIGFEWGPNILNLSFLNFILNICCFFCVSCLLLSLFCESRP